ncbi:RICIN domain-containing protein [Streptomyces griseus]|uniref:RICIN domain-containing protein n=1 Tax=Streptomyces griseus TaxID=1911 RepID=UPI00382111F6
MALANPGDAQSFQNQATGRCIDDTDNGFRTWSCNGSYAQKWNIISWTDGTRQLRSVNTARCMEDTDNGFRTVQTCNSSREQSWWVKVWNDGSIRFQNQATGRCIDDSSLGFRTWACNDTAFQSWF